MRRPRKDLGPAGKVLGHLAGTAAGLRPRPGSDPAACIGCRWLSAPPSHGARWAFWVGRARRCCCSHEKAGGIAKGLATVGHSSAGLLVRAHPCGVMPGPGWWVIRQDAREVVRHATTVWTRARAAAGQAPRPGRSGGRVTAAAVLALVLAACVGCTSGGSTAAPAAATTPAATTPAAVPGGGAALQQDYVSAIRRVLPSVVEIKTASGLGSGVVYDIAGHIVTNAHVVGAATSFQVFLAGSARPLPARLTGSYPRDDLAVIKVSGAAHLVPAHFADSSKLQVGDIVLAMGNPLGLASSATDGIVSAVGRTVSEPQQAGSPGATLPDVIQTSAAINPGNSGGALVDLTDQVVGIPTLAATDQQLGGAAPGIGFAIPANIVTDIAGQIIKTGHVTNSHRAALGVRGADRHRAQRPARRRRASPR